MSKSCLTLLLLSACLAACSAQSAPQADNTPPVDATYISATVASLQSLIEQKYFNEAAIPRINSSLAGALAGGDLSQSKDLNELAARLTSVLYESTHDKHLFVSVSAPSVHGGGTPQMTRAEAARLSNYGMKAAKVLEGNVGYLEVTSFYRRDEGAETIDAAMRFLARTDALILDFRNNGGGSPETAVQLLSYFFAEPNLTLFAIVPRSGETEVERTVQAGVAYRDESRPLYILVSAHTWSAGEGVPFLLQERSRAKVIGETTAGAANPAAPYHINPALSVTIPFGRIESAVKKTNWEGVGVAPDTVVSPDKAFQEAYVQALEEILARTSDSSKRQALSSALVNARK